MARSWQTRVVIDMSALQMWFAVLIGWLDCQEPDALAYLIEENRILRTQLGGPRLRLTDTHRRRLAVRAFQVDGGHCRKSPRS
jgi:hypothetical protein